MHYMIEFDVKWFTPEENIMRTSDRTSLSMNSFGIAVDDEEWFEPKEGSVMCLPQNHSQNRFQEQRPVLCPIALPQMSPWRM